MSVWKKLSTGCFSPILLLASHHFQQFWKFEEVWRHTLLTTCSVPKKKKIYYSALCPLIQISNMSSLGRFPRFCLVRLHHGKQNWFSWSLRPEYFKLHRPSKWWPSPHLLCLCAPLRKIPEEVSSQRGQIAFRFTLEKRNWMELEQVVICSSYLKWALKSSFVNI